jgi:hypothetical protein
VRKTRHQTPCPLTLASVYHPCTKTGINKTYLHFLDTLNTLLNHLPAKYKVIMGAVINANIGKLDNLHSANFRAALGPHGLPKCNPKGASLLTTYLAHCLRIMNTFFETKTNSPSHSTSEKTKTAPPYHGDFKMIDPFVPTTKKAHSTWKLETPPQPSLSSNRTPPLSRHQLACLQTTISTHGLASPTARIVQVSSALSFYTVQKRYPQRD